MIFCVVPEPLAPELYDQLAAYYEDDPNVTVIIDRRKSSRRDRGVEQRGWQARDPRSPADARGGRVPADHRRRRSLKRRRPRVRVVVHVDGGSRGNPGPAAAAAVVSSPEGEVLDEAAVTIGRATNNVAEYRGLLLGLERARALGATEVDVVNDSELIAHQVNGRYKVKHPDMKPLHAEALAALRGFERWSIRPVPRAENADADALVNQALDGERALSPGPSPPAAPSTPPTC